MDVLPQVVSEYGATEVVTEDEVEYRCVWGVWRRGYTRVVLGWEGGTGVEDRALTV